MYEFNIVNTSSKRRIIKNVCHEYSTEKGGFYCPGLQHLKFPVYLEPGESVQYEINYADFNGLLVKSNATKIRILITDSFGKKYNSKWIKVEQWDIPVVLKNKGFQKASSNWMHSKKS